MSPAIVIFSALGLVLLVGGGLVVSGMLTGSGESSQVQERLVAYALVPEESSRRRRAANLQIVRLRVRLNAMLSAFASQEVALQLASASWPVTVTEYMLLRLGALTGGFLLGWLISGSALPGLGLGVILYFVPGILLNRSVNRRRRQFERQLVDVLVLINGAVRSGFSLLQAMEVVEKEVAPPASEEFRRVRREVSLGFSIPQALDSLAARMGNQDLGLVVTAIKIHHQVGGNLSTMLNAVTETVRDRLRLFRELRVITTQQRYTSYLLSLLPVFMAGMMFMMSPEYVSSIFEPGIYLCFPIGSVIGIILGQLVLRRIVRIEV